MKKGRVLEVLGWSLALGLAVFTGISLPSSGFGFSAPQRSTATEAAPADGDGEKGELRVPLAPAFSVQELTALPEEGWITNGGTLFNQRYSPLSQISRSNVAGLKGVWEVHLESATQGRYRGEAQPLVYQGVIYVISAADDVLAIEVKSGRVLWKYEAHLDPEINTVCCVWTSRGVALGEGKVYVGQLDGRLVALDQGTGEPLWSIQVEKWQEGYTITSAPLYYNGLVITGISGGEFGIRGQITAYNAQNGQKVWRFYTVPGPGELGHETWPQDSEIWKKGGAPVWQTPAVDPSLGLLYFSTGNPGPDYHGGIRAGDNLFATAIVALEVETGKYRWHFQEVHHDLWDYDAPNPVVLFDLEIDGVMRKAAAQAGKTGWVYILDRITGEPLLGIEERPVPQEPRQKTSPTQPYPLGDAFVPQSIPEELGGGKLVNQGRIFTPFWDEEVLVRPGNRGGANWPPSSYDPSSHYLYVCASDTIRHFIVEADLALPSLGERFRGGMFGSSDLQPENRGIVAAMDMSSNRLVWRQEWKEACYAGSVVTAGGLVFLGKKDGNFVALDSRNGATLWQFQTEAEVSGTATVFQQDGQQYIVVLSAGARVDGTGHGDSLWLFSLSGTLEPVEVTELTQ